MIQIFNKNSIIILIIIGFFSCEHSSFVDNSGSANKNQSEYHTESDREPLIALYDSLGGKNWSNNLNWCSEKNIDEWWGVECNESGRVVELNLSTNNLKGEIPSQLYQLTEIEKLFLKNNSIVGNISDSIKSLNQLKSLSISYNLLEGEIPKEIGSLEKLENISLRYNRFTGTIPTSFYSDKNSKNWNKWSWKIIPQQSGYGFKPDYPATYIDSVTIATTEGEKIKIPEYFTRHKLTCIVSWITNNVFCEKFITNLSEQYYNYKDKGLTILATTPEDTLLANFTNYKSTNNYVVPYIEPNYYPTWLLVDSSGMVYYNELLNSGITTTREAKLNQLLSDFFSTDENSDKDTSQLPQNSKVKTLHSSKFTARGVGVNFIIMGDGFIEEDMGEGGKYEECLESAGNSLLDIEPLKSYKDYINIYSVDVVSENEGITDDRETPLSTFFGSGTLIGGNDKRVLEFASAVEGIDLKKAIIIVVANSPRHAGTCYTYATGERIAYLPYKSYSKSEMGNLVHHEAIGHGLGGLLDEYTYYNKYITYEYISLFEDSRKRFNLGYNLTLEIDNNEWSKYSDIDGYDMVSNHEGGFFFNYGVWRSEFISCMDDNRPYFSAISRELIVRKIMKLSEEEFNFEKFIEIDKKSGVLESQAASIIYKSKSEAHLHPPVLVD